MIERLHDDIIAALLNAAKCSIQFTTTKRHNNTSPRSGWKEHVAMYRAEAMNWHALWLSCGCPSEGYAFNTRNATRSTYHTQIKYIERNELVILLMIFLMVMMFLNVLLTRLKMFLIKWVLTVLT